MAEKMRVHLLADELGVSSKAILAKCKAEGLDIRNHMSTLTAGQTATIREWFSEGAHTIAVEESDRVDLVTARTRRTRKKTAKHAEEHIEEAEGGDVATTAEAVETTVAEEAIVEVAPSEGELSEEVTEAVPAEAAAAAAEESQAEALSPELAPSAVILPAVPDTPAVELKPHHAVKGHDAAKAHAPAVEHAKVEPPKPEPVRPAGPQNVPAPAVLKGPRVVRVERPEPIFVRPPRPPMGRGPAMPGPVESPAMPGRKVKGKDVPADGEEGPAKQGTKHRVHPRRTNRSVEAGERLQEWRDRDLIERQEKIQAASGRGIHARRAIDKKEPGGFHVAPRKTRAEITEPIILHEFCSVTGIGLQQIAPKLIREHSIMPNRNTVLDSDLAQILAVEHGVELVVHKPKTPLDLLQDEFESRPRPNPKKRPPVVTFLGHVDHGKTSLLDAIRKTRVVAGEAGGITQHIGAYRLDRGGLSVTFLDTPGHEAFTAMRARGANMTDVVVLVVAADDGVMPQTVEAINHAKAAKVPIVVALNKIDLPGADTNRVFGQLSEHQLVPQQWGGDVDVIETSATKGIGIDEIFEHLATLSDLLDLKSDPDIPAVGTVIEAEMREGVGAAARVLIQEGTLREGSIIQCGPGAGRVRALTDNFGKRLQEAGPGTPVEIAGLDEVPDAGDRLFELSDLQRAKEIALSVLQQRREQSLTRLSRPKTLEELYTERQKGEIPTLNLILRADMQGSVDVLKKTLSEIPSDEVKLQVLHAAVGSVTEGDVVLAEASNALIVGFHVVPDAAVQRFADDKGVEIKLYRVIYNLIDDIRKALSGLLEPEKNEEFRARLEVRQVFSVSRIGKVAGCFVVEGTIKRSNYVRVLRNGRIIIPTADDAERGRHRSLTSLRRFKDDASEVRNGFECGLKIEDYDDIQSGDVIEAYEVVEKARSV